jgi:elongation factor Ts
MTNKHMEELKQLRDRTGAGIVDCKTALTEANGDIEKAIEILRKKGISKAAKRSDRETKAGVIIVSVTPDAKEGYLLEMNAETDFVVRNDKFKDLGKQVLEVIKINKPKNLEELLALKLADGVSVSESWQHLSGVIGEKMGLNRYDKLTTAGTIAGYAHPQGNIGVLVALSVADANDLARDIAMHIAAANPRYINSAEVDPTELAKEKEIYSEQLKKEGKPEAMLEKILIGKMNKFYEEVCLVDQEYIKDDKKKVKDILNGATIEKFIRYSL